MTVVTDNTHAAGEGTRKDVEDKDIPIGFVGYNKDYGKSAMDALSPKYKAVLADETVEGFVDKLKGIETTPRAVFIGPAYPLEKQDLLEKLINDAGILCHVIKTNPPEEKFGDLMERSKDMPELDRVGWMTRQMFDRAHLE